MALSFLYLMTRRLLDMLPWKLAKRARQRRRDRRAPPPTRRAAPPGQATEVPTRRPCAPGDAERHAPSHALVELPCHPGYDPALAPPAGHPQVDAAPAWRRAPGARQRCGCADPAAGPRESTVGYRRIQGELRKLGVSGSATTIPTVLRRNGLG